MRSFLVRIFLYSVRMQQNTDQENSVLGHYSRSVLVFLVFSGGMKWEHLLQMDNFSEHKFEPFTIFTKSSALGFWMISEYVYIPRRNRKAADRSSLQEVFCKKGALKNFAKFTGKHLCQGLLFDRVASLMHATLLKKETLEQVFSCRFCEFFKNIFLKEHLLETAFVSIL